VKIHAAWDGIAQNFGACRFVEGTCVGAKEDLAISRVRAKPEQRPERMAMYHTVALVQIQPENQGINIVAPSGRIFAAGQAINSVHGPIVSTCAGRGCVQEYSPAAARAWLSPRLHYFAR
jgi:hypothetical protein